MEMCYDEVLVMPDSYAVMEEEEMMYLEGGKSCTASFQSVGAAQSYFRKLGASYRSLAVVGGLGCALTGTALGACLGGIYGAVIGAAIGFVGGYILGSVVYGWGTTYYNCAYDLSKYKKSKKCSVTITNYGTQLYYSIKIK